MAKRRQGAGTSAGVLAAIGMAAVGAFVALVTGLGQGIGAASPAPPPQHSVSVSAGLLS